MNGRIGGSGRACQRPRTSSGAKCFSCEGALAREIAFFKFLAIIKHWRCAGRSEFLLRAKPERGEGRGARRLKTARAWPRAAQHIKLFVCIHSH